MIYYSDKHKGQVLALAVGSIELIVAHFIKIFPVLHGIQKCIAVFTSACPRTLF
jgi:hypothetical protein